MNLPITEQMVKALNLILKEMSPKGKLGEDLRSWLPYQVAGTHRIDKMTVGQGAR